MGFIVSPSAEMKGLACAGRTLPSRDTARQRSGAPHRGEAFLKDPPKTPFAPPYLLKISFLLAQIAEDGGQLQRLPTAGVVRVHVPGGRGTQNLGHPAFKAPRI